jgi:hypothetical protein
MQQRLMLRRRTMRRRQRCHRLHALALGWKHQSSAIVPQRPGPVGMPDHAHKTLDVRRKPRFTVIRFSIIYRSPSAEVNLDQELIRQQRAPATFLTQ